MGVMERMHCWARVRNQFVFSEEARDLVRVSRVEDFRTECGEAEPVFPRFCRNH